MTSTSYPENIQDWCGRFIANLVASVAHQENIQLSLWAPPGEIPSSVTAAATQKDSCWLRHLSQQNGIAHLLRSHGILAAWKVVSLLSRIDLVYRQQLAALASISSPGYEHCRSSTHNALRIIFKMPCIGCGDNSAASST